MLFFLNYGYKFTGISNFVQFPKNVPGADVEADEKNEGTVPNQCINLKKYFNHAPLGAAIDSIPFIWNRAGARLTCSVYIFVTQHAITYFIALVGLGHLDSIQRHFGERKGGQIYNNISHLTVEDHLFPVSLYRDPCTAPISNTAFQYTWKQEFNQDSEYTICTVCVCVHIWSHAGCLDPRGSALFLLPL